MSVYESLGLKPIINASGSVTRLGGAPMPKTVVDSFRDAAREWVPIEQLQAAASKVIAQVTSTEAGIVTAGSSAALTLGAASILAGYDLGRMEMLPHCAGFPDEFVVSREHRNGYDHAVRAAGARFVEVGFNEVGAGAGVRRTEAWEYAAAFGDRTAGVFYVFKTGSQPPLEKVVEVAHAHGHPVLVDAAGELPPRSNLLLASVTGADLVTFSGGKAIRGPQSTGILCGRRDLIGSAALQMLDMDDLFELWDPPRDLIDKDKLSGIPRHGIGRALKVSKEEIVAFMTALAIFAKGAQPGERELYYECLEIVARPLADKPVRCEVVEPDDEEGPPVLEIRLGEDCQSTALDVCRRLRRGTPPIYVGHGKLDEGTLVIHPFCLGRMHAEVIGSRLVEEI